MWAWIVRLIGGWIPLGNKPIGEWAGKLIWVAGIVTLCLTIYHFIMRPTNTTTNDAEIINNYTSQPKATFGCATTKIMEGGQDGLLRKQKEKGEKEVK